MIVFMIINSYELLNSWFKEILYDVSKKLILLYFAGISLQSSYDLHVSHPLVLM